MTKSRRKKSAPDSRPLTPKEQAAVERQGETLAWTRETHERTTGEPPDGLWTRGTSGP